MGGDISIESTLTTGSITVPSNGYVYIFLSNESSFVPVYFDNFQVAHTRGAMVEDNAYYPFGLKIAAISTKAFDAPKNPYQYQGDYAEYDDETGYNEFELRSYDPQIGRFIQVDPYEQFPSPYTGMGNEPVNNVDPSGGWAAAGIFQGMSQAGIMATTTLGGAIIGGAIDMISGGDGTKGLMIGAGIGLASNFASAFNWGSVDIGKIASLGLNAANVATNVASQIMSNDVSYERYLSDDYRNNDLASNSSGPPGFFKRLWGSYQRLDRWAGEHGVDWINENINPVTPFAELITGKQFYKGNFNTHKPRLQSLGGVIITILPGGKVVKTAMVLGKAELKAIASLESQIAKHQTKLAEYIKDPLKFDNKGFLKNAPSEEIRQKIIQTRINHLKQEINTFQNNIQKILNGQ